MGAHRPRRGAPRSRRRLTTPPTTASPTYARVVVEVAPAHLDRPFDYRIPDGVEVGVGTRVRVTFAGRRRTGWVVGTAAEPGTDPARVRDLDAVEGGHAWFGDADLRLYRWVADRYAATLADVLRHALPPRVAAVEREASGWGPPSPVAPAERPPPGAGGLDPPHPPPSGVGGLDPPHPPGPATAWRPYAASRLLKAAARAQPTTPGAAFWWRPLPGDDAVAMSLDLVARCLSAGRSALVLAPDPSSPLPGEALALAGPAGADLRAGAERDRYRAFLRCRLGHARVAVAERGGSLAPLPGLGLVVVADEANPAYKERRAPRHHAREVALARAWLAGATAVLLGDLPSARLERLLADGHVETVAADRGRERERAPLVEIVDPSGGGPAARRGRFAPLVARRIAETVRAGGVAVVVAARGGQGAALACQGCGARRACPTCDGSIRPRRGAGGEEGGVWECPACRWEAPPSACPRCGDERTAPLAAGAGRLAQELSRSHPAAEVVRMEGFDAPGPAGRPAIAVMTRGSAVERPAWLGERGAGVVVLPDADALLRRPAFDSAEDALRLWFAVARWAGRVVLQTREPAHPAVQALVRWDPRGFWTRESERRAELRYPPAASLVRLQAPAELAAAVAGELRQVLGEHDELLGPDAGGALLVKSASLRGTLDALAPLRRAWSTAGKRVRVDVDPVVLD